MRKPSALLFVAIVTLGIILGFSAITVKGDTPGTVTLLEPTGSEEILFYEKITVKFSVTCNPGWFYSGSRIYIGGVKVDTTGDGLRTPFEKNYYPETYAGEQSVTITSFFINFFLEEDDVSDYEYFTVKICNDTQDLEDMRIDKLHEYESGKGSLFGEGVKICIIDDRLGCDSSNGMFHKSLYRSGKNDIYDYENRKFIDIKYYEYNSTTEEFEEDWEPGTNTRLEKWEELYNENKGTYDEDTDVHGTYCLASLRRIAPAAKYTFISHGDNGEAAYQSMFWIHENYYDLEFDIISVSFEGYSDWVSLVVELANQDAIVVHAAGNDGITFEWDTEDRTLPCTNDSAIGVTGVLDGYHGSSSDRWKTDSRANTGYGIEIAAIYEASELDWAPVPGINEFKGTSNACPMVAGIIALIEQYQKSYKSGTYLTVTIVQLFFEKTGDAPGHPPSYYGNEINGTLDWINEEGYHPDFPYSDYQNLFDTYNYGWGIIDGYEMYKYFRQHY